ncbi:MAG: hypothetical protein L6R19_21195 [Alphaproteobacteria bacterium]|nr:hypothetical protein [Alphaproteobacteria bacterium]
MFVDLFSYVENAFKGLIFFFYNFVYSVLNLCYRPRQSAVTFKRRFADKERLQIGPATLIFVNSLLVLSMFGAVEFVARVIETRSGGGGAFQLLIEALRKYYEGGNYLDWIPLIAGAFLTTFIIDIGIRIFVIVQFRRTHPGMKRIIENKTHEDRVYARVNTMAYVASGFLYMWLVMIPVVLATCRWLVGSVNLGSAGPEIGLVVLLVSASPLVLYRYVEPFAAMHLFGLQYLKRQPAAVRPWWSHDGWWWNCAACLRARSGLVAAFIAVGFVWSGAAGFWVMAFVHSSLGDPVKSALRITAIECSYLQDNRLVVTAHLHNTSHAALDLRSTGFVALIRDSGFLGWVGKLRHSQPLAGIEMNPATRAQVGDMILKPGDAMTLNFSHGRWLNDEIPLSPAVLLTRRTCELVSRQQHDELTHAEPYWVAVLQAYWRSILGEPPQPSLHGDIRPIFPATSGGN